MPGLATIEDLLFKGKQPNPDHRTVVRLTTSCWGDNKGVYMKKSLRFLKRKCLGERWVDEEISNIGAEYVVPAIKGIESLPDGVYELAALWSNPHAGHPEDCGDGWECSFELIPFNEGINHPTPRAKGKRRP